MTLDLRYLNYRLLIKRPSRENNFKMSRALSTKYGGQMALVIMHAYIVGFYRNY
jgi:hypothetical protein